MYNWNSEKYEDLIKSLPDSDKFKLLEEAEQWREDKNKDLPIGNSLTHTLLVNLFNFGIYSINNKAEFYSELYRYFAVGFAAIKPLNRKID